MNLPKLTAITRERKTYLDAKRFFVETIHEVDMVLENGTGICIAADTRPRGDEPEIRALCEYMAAKNIATVGEMANATAEITADYDKQEVVVSLLKVASIAEVVK